MIARVFGVTFETGCTDGRVRKEVEAASEAEAREIVEREIEGEGGVVVEVEETETPLVDVALFLASSLVWTASPYRGAEVYSTNIVPYGVRDSKGRACGGCALVEPRIGSTSGVREDGTLFEEFTPYPGEWVISTGATRDGNGFGAIPRGTVFTGTLDEAKKFAKKKLAAAARRFAKAAAKGEGRQFAKKGAGR